MTARAARRGEYTTGAETRARDRLTSRRIMQTFDSESVLVVVPGENERRAPAAPVAPVAAVYLFP